MSPYDPVPRALAIVARTVHLLAMAGYVGLLLQGRREGRDQWRLATTLSGAALLATEASHSRHWPYQGRGLLTIAHIAVLLLGHVSARAATPVAIAALVIGAVVSHLPRWLRKWSLVHRRVVTDEWTRGQAGTGESASGQQDRHRSGVDDRRSPLGPT
jgi:hypothetical protein